jgi:transposase
LKWRIIVNWKGQPKWHDSRQTVSEILGAVQWQKLKPILLDLNIYDKPSLKETFLGIIYRLKTGCPWRYLPNYYGKANIVFKAFRRWSASGLFYRLFKRLIKNADMEWVSIDATHIRAHQSSAGAASGDCLSTYCQKYRWQQLKNALSC